MFYAVWTKVYVIQVGSSSYTLFELNCTLKWLFSVWIKLYFKKVAFSSKCAFICTLAVCIYLCIGYFQWFICFSYPCGGGWLTTLACLESQGWHFIPLSLFSLIFCLVLLLSLSCSFSANGSFPRLFQKKILKSCCYEIGFFFFYMVLVDSSLVGAACSDIVLVFYRCAF